MKANRSADTKPEVALRRELHQRGLRFRKNHRLDLPERRVRPDIVFTRSKVAVFVDGCFWHGCPEHGSQPKANAEYWISKLRANVARDALADHALVSDGWAVVRVWEHQDVGQAAETVASVVRTRSVRGN
jgi:DNA mismatch endonuclease (patch repair protein)